MRTLLIEDDESTREMLGMLLKDRGHDVTSCGDAETAWQSFKRNPFSLVVTDLMLPGMSGQELIHRINQHSHRKYTTVLVCTGRNSAEDLDSVLDAGADDYLTKPFDPDVFKIRVRIAEQQAIAREERKVIEESLNNLVQHVTLAQEAIISMGLDGTIIAWNQKATELYGYTSQEAVGRSITILMPDEKKHELAHLIENIKGGTKISNYETVRRCKDGTNIHIAITMAPIKSADGKIIGATTIPRDISAKAKLDEELRATESRLRRLFDSDLIGVVFWNLDGRLALQR